MVFDWEQATSVFALKTCHVFFFWDPYVMLKDLTKKDTLLAFAVAIVLQYVSGTSVCDAIFFSACFVLTFLSAKQLLGI